MTIPVILAFLCLAVAMEGTVYWYRSGRYAPNKEEQRGHLLMLWITAGSIILFMVFLCLLGVLLYQILFPDWTEWKQLAK